jgi:hypothetical protein
MNIHFEPVQSSVSAKLSETEWVLARARSMSAGKSAIKTTIAFSIIASSEPKKAPGFRRRVFRVDG